MDPNPYHHARVTVGVVRGASGYRLYAGDGVLVGQVAIGVPVPDLSDDERAALERWAAAHPHELDRLWPLSERERGYLLALTARMPAHDPATYPATYPATAREPQVQFLLDCAADVLPFLT